MSAKQKDTADRPKKSPVPARIMLPRLLLILSAVVLIVLGLVMIYSASSITALDEFEDSAYYLKNQLQFIVIGLVLVLITIRIRYEFWDSNVSWIPWGLVMILLVITAVMGVAGLGAQRWVSLGPLGGFQPSEFMKIAVILLLANFVTVFRKGGMSNKGFFIGIAVIVFIPALFIIAQPDLGTTIILLIVAFAVLWFGEIELKIILIIVAVIFAVGLIGIAIEPYRFARIIAAFDPWSDPLGDGYQLINALYAFGSGGLTGVGLGLSRQKYLYLPEAHTDFIFAVIGEELGLLGALVVIVLFIVFIYAGIQISRNSPTIFGRMVAGSATITIGTQAFLNMACTLGLFPITGKPLPFISSGGSSLLATLILTGLILGVSFQSDVPDRQTRSRLDFKIYEGGGVNVQRASQGRRSR
ncbi:MAG: putative lipid II flippase FtsW [Actinobacteria bacterium]|nr:putative lipid II flippase FtsW [Actinomycetota bacterium]